MGLPSYYRTLPPRAGKNGEVPRGELCGAFEAYAREAGEPITLNQIEPTTHSRVFKLHVGTLTGQRVLIAKCCAAHIGHREVRVTRRWLPLVGLERLATPPLASSISSDGCRLWHIYKNLGPRTLSHCIGEKQHLERAIQAIVDIHSRFFEHPVLAEVRSEATYGPPALSANIEDADRALRSALSVCDWLEADDQSLLDRLRERVSDLRSVTADPVDLESKTLVHGDLFPDNILMPAGSSNVRLIDWDHVGIGDTSYDLSQLLRRIPPNGRSYALKLYRDHADDAGLTLQDPETLGRLMEAAELERLTNAIIWPALGLLENGADWAIAELRRIDQWFDELKPAAELIGDV